MGAKSDYAAAAARRLMRIGTSGPPDTTEHALHHGKKIRVKRKGLGDTSGRFAKGLKSSVTAKPKTVNLGSKGSFTINHPGVERARAQAAGMSTAAYAQAHKGDPGVVGRQSRAAIGLMAMGKR